AGGRKGVPAPDQADRDVGLADGVHLADRRLHRAGVGGQGDERLQLAAGVGAVVVGAPVARSEREGLALPVRVPVAAGVLGHPLLLGQVLRLRIGVLVDVLEVVVDRAGGPGVRVVRPEVGHDPRLPVAGGAGLGDVPALETGLHAAFPVLAYGFHQGQAVGGALEQVGAAAAGLVALGTA